MRSPLRISGPGMSHNRGEIVKKPFRTAARIITPSMSQRARILDYNQVRQAQRQVKRYFIDPKGQRVRIGRV